MPEALITFCGQRAKVACDGLCQKACGIQGRPKIELSDDPDDYVWLADNELGEAPADNGIREGDDAKPATLMEFPNKWCVRECERCAMSQPDEWHLPLKPKDFSKRRYNMPFLHTSEIK